MNGVSRISRVSSRPNWVRERLIGALIPDGLGPSDETTPVPLAVLPALRRLDHRHPATVLVSTSRMDRNGPVNPGGIRAITTAVTAPLSHLLGAGPSWARATGR